MSLIPDVITQRGYPGAGDIDDCWVVATVWAERASRPDAFKPTVPYFRAKAGVPDIPGPSGGNIDECYKGAKGCWPSQAITLYKSAGIEPLLANVRAGHPASIALDSGDLPARLRFGFLGKHQVGGMGDGRTIYIANPLAPNGSRPLPITASELARAMIGLLPPTVHTRFRALIFPKPIPVSIAHWGGDIPDDFRDAYSADQVAAKLKAVGIPKWGVSINRVDIEAGCDKRGIDYGTSIQLVDLRAFMRPGTN